MSSHITPSEPVFSIRLYTVEIEKDRHVLKPMQEKHVPSKLKELKQTNNLARIAIMKNNEFVIAKDHFVPGRKIILIEDGRETDLTGRVREATEQDFRDIQTFAAQYFAKMNEREERADEKVAKRAWQNEVQSDTGRRKEVKKARERVNEAAERGMQAKMKKAEELNNEKTGAKIRRFYEELTEKNGEYYEKKRESNKIN